MQDEKMIKRDIFRLIIPNVLENLLQVLAGVVSTAMIGRLLTDDISAQGISLRVVQTLWSLMKGIGVGATVAVALQYGAGRFGKCKRIVEQSYLTMIPITILMCLFIFLFPSALLGIFTDEVDIVQRGIGYIRICVWYLPFAAIIIGNTAAFNGRGNTKTPMYIALLLNIVNVGVGYLLIYGIGNYNGMGVKGAAWAMLISQAVGAFTGLYLLYKRNGLYIDSRHDERFFKFDRFTIKEVYATGFPAGMESMLWQLSAIILSKVILDYGSDYYAAYQLGLQAEMMTEMPAVGFITAATTLSAKAIGQRDSALFKSYNKELMKMASVIAVLAAAALFIFPNQFMSMLTDKADLRQIGALYVFIMGFSQIPQVLSKVYNGTTRAAGHKKAPMYISAIGIWGLRVPLVILIGWVFKADIIYIWIAIAIDQIARLFMSMGYFHKKKVLDAVDKILEEEAVA